MSILTTVDRAFTIYARLVQKQTLGWVASQKILRAIFAATAPLSARMPKGWRAVPQAGGHLMLAPQTGKTNGTLLYIHGGGFTIGAPSTAKPMAAHIAQAAGLRAVCLRYPLAPEHPYPAAPDAVFEAYRAQVASGDVPAAIGGDSAGGNLALLTLQRARDAGLPLPRAVVLIAPLVDVSADLEARFGQAEGEVLIPPAWAKRLKPMYMAGADPSAPGVNPAAADLRGLPPTLVHAAQGEALVQDANFLVERMDEATLDLWPGLPHVWHINAGVAPAATQACAELGAFIKAQL